MAANEKRGMGFWAKTDRKGRPAISVEEHMVYVGEVCRVLMEGYRRWLDCCGLVDVEGLLALVALHDVGKISPNFQAKCVEWLRRNGLEEQAKREGWTQPGTTRHEVISQFTLERAGGSTSAGREWIKVCAALGAHHGHLHYRPRGVYRDRWMREDDEWHQWRKAAVEAIQGRFGRFPEISRPLPDAFYFWLAGLTTVADWIGSDERFFPTDSSVPLDSVREVAERAVRSVGLRRPRLKSGLTFEEIFGWPPNDLQRKVMEVVTGPGVYVIEAPMGMGKTEAALMAAYRLMERGDAGGLYFALPTRTTSERIHRRVLGFLSRIAPDDAEARLIHGSSWLQAREEDVPKAEGGETAGEVRQDSCDWFLSAKRSLLAPFGVGTIDQALLGVVAAKHFFVRQFALANKVVVIDEVHSYDLYTGTLVDILIRRLKEMGSTAIVLSATLTDRRRWELLGGEAPQRQVRPPSVLMWRYGEGEVEGTVVSSPPERRVKVLRAAEDDAVTMAVSEAEQGASVLWIADTVHDAQRFYLRLKERRGGSDWDLGILHSRFPKCVRDRIEETWLERLGKRGDRSRGCVLVSTQVVEQSVDVDADILVTETAPTDMLFQRLGRLWRHPLAVRPTKEPLMVLLREMFDVDEARTMDKAAFVESLGPKAKVYHPYVLMRTLEVWEGLDEVVLPFQIHALLDATYADRTESGLGVELKEDLELKKETLRRRALVSSAVWNMPETADGEDAEALTRVGGVTERPLVLARGVDGDRVVLWDGTAIRRKGPFGLSEEQAAAGNSVMVPSWLVAGLETAVLEGMRGKWDTFVVPDADGRIGSFQQDGGYIVRWSEETGLSWRGVA